MNPHIHWNRRFTKRWRLNSVRAGGPAVFTKFVIPRCSDVCMCASFSLGLGFFPPACRHRTTKSCRSRVSLCWSGLWQLGINLSLLTMVFLGDSHKSLTFYWYAVLIWRSWREPRGRDWDRKLPITTNHRSFFPHSNQILVGFSMLHQYKAPEKQDQRSKDARPQQLSSWCFGVIKTKSTKSQVALIIPSYILIKSGYYLAMIQV